MFANPTQLPPVLFVCGAPRSGTTLLQALLCSSPDTNPLIGEAIHLAHLVAAYGNSRDVHQLGETDDYFADLEDLRNFYRQAIAIPLDRVWRRTDRPRCLVLKSPGLTPHLPDLLELVPNSRAVVAVRDPRDGAASLRAIGLKAEVSLSENEPLTIEQRLARQPSDRLAQHFCQHYATVLACRDAAVWARLRFVRYEALVERPQAAIAQLQAFTGLDLSCDPARPWQRSAIDFQQLPERYRSWWSGQGYGDRISDASIGRYRRDFSAEEIREIEAACGGWMRRFGYATERETSQLSGA
ncbi:MAG: sulfotransferase [Geitlerinemataceae cyanobacterium]